MGYCSHVFCFFIHNWLQTLLLGYRLFFLHLIKLKSLALPAQNNDRLSEALTIFGWGIIVSFQPFWKNGTWVGGSFLVHFSSSDLVSVNGHTWLFSVWSLWGSPSFSQPAHLLFSSGKIAWANESRKKIGQKQESEREWEIDEGSSSILYSLLLPLGSLPSRASFCGCIDDFYMI